MLRWMMSLAIAVWLIAVIGSLFVDAPSIGTPINDAPSRGDQPRKQAKHSRGIEFLQQNGRPLAGFAINFHYNDDRELYLKAIDELAGLGCNAVLISTPAFQTNGASTDIRLEVGPGRGPYRERIIELIKRAKEHGMVTALMPTVLFTAPRGGEWRGRIVPDSWDKWWASYKRMTDHFTAIANEAEVDLYVVGSELLTTEKQTQRWQKIIAHVRQQFDGALTYSGNWDHYNEPTFWGQLDFVAMNGYFDLKGDHEDDHPPIEHVTEQWQAHREQVLAFATSQGKPLLFTEMGYPSAPWGLKDPWDYLPFEDSVIDAAVQHDGYDAFFRTWMHDLNNVIFSKPIADGEAPFAGVFFYEWDPYRSGEINDIHYGIRGKPAFKLIKDRLAEFNADR